MSVASKGKPKSKSHRENISKGHKGKPKPWQQGKRNVNYGGTIINQAEIKLRHLEASKKRGQAWNKNDRKRHSVTMFGPSNKMRGRKHTEETKAKIRDKKNALLKAGLVRFGGNKISAPERNIARLLRQMGVVLETQFHIKALPYNYDFYFPNINLIIELHGDYWHCNPKKYKSGQYVKLQRIGEKLVDDVWARDAKKKGDAEQLGYMVEVIWVSDYKKHGIDGVLEIINKYVKK